MKQVKVLGTGCANCRATTQRVEQIAKELGVPITLEKVEAIQDIMAFGILATPGVVIDGNVVHSGSVPTREKIASWPLTGCIDTPPRIRNGPSSRRRGDHEHITIRRPSGIAMRRR